MALVVMKRVLITGGSSGIGLEASRLLLLSGHQLTLCCRSQDRCEQTQQTLLNAGADSDLIDYLVVDLADLQSVSQACQQLLQQGNPIDVLVLNAGQQRAGDPKPAFSAQGIELTFAVNQLAHQWMLMQLLPLLKATPQPRLVITASDVHDPATGGGRVGQPAGLADLAGLKCGADFVMLDGNDRFDGEKAYKDSKLCNVLMGREIDRQLQGALPVIAWSPGLVIPKGQGGFFRFNRERNPLGMAIFSLVARDLLRVTESLPTAGRLLADLAADAVFTTPGFTYLSNRLVRPGLHRFAAVETSKEATDLEKAAELWRLSERLIGSVLADRSRL